MAPKAPAGSAKAPKNAPNAPAGSAQAPPMAPAPPAGGAQAPPIAPAPPAQAPPIAPKAPAGGVKATPKASVSHAVFLQRPTVLLRKWTPQQLHALMQSDPPSAMQVIASNRRYNVQVRAINRARYEASAPDHAPRYGYLKIVNEESGDAHASAPFRKSAFDSNDLGRWTPWGSFYGFDWGANTPIQKIRNDYLVMLGLPRPHRGY
ncbi:hypothetical protein FN846DRAFT_886797 [Sphaerosporella brunnea]|uniref:Uncharacterized protein n=1 Tax=Sphaerosporella brunnea TaxID=1250544 RepID=A0A5J5F7P2_9PEZI|nr:hypothetical protein FN846DRAFT_886797 [Sphaerosporella brunnea]